MPDLVPVKIRELPAGSTLDNANIETAQGNVPGVSYKVPAKLLTGPARSYIKSRNLTAPPVAPGEGDRYIVKVGGTGAWAGKDGLVAEWLLLLDPAGVSTGAWFFYVPTGVNFVEDEGVAYAFGVAGATPLAGRNPTRSVAGNFVTNAADSILFVDTRAADASTTLPVAHQTVTFVDEYGNAAAHPITITPDGGNTINFSADPQVIAVNSMVRGFMFNPATNNWSRF